MADYRINREDLWLVIQDKRYAQDERHGGPAHDDTHSRREWVSLIVRYLGNADRHADELAVDGYQDAMLNVATLAVAAIESVDRIACGEVFVSANLSAIKAEVKRSHEIINGQTEEIAALREALAPFANQAAEKGVGGKYSALTETQWRRALETYQACPGGDMCGCEPQGRGQ